MKKIEIAFNFRGRQYNATIRARQKPEGREFAITARNWELERLLYGNHLIDEKEGALHVNALPGKMKQMELKLIIAARLSEHLKLPCFVGDQCLVSGPPEETWEDLHPIPRHPHKSL